MSDTGHPKPVLSDNWSDGVGREVGGGFRRERTCVCLWLIHVHVWQNPSQYCKVIILQLYANIYQEWKRRVKWYIKEIMS